MKLLVFAVCVTVLSCNSSAISKSPEASPSKTKSSGENIISFKANGQEVNTSGWVITRFSYHNNPQKIWLNITSNMKEDPHTINVNLNGSVPGEYPMGGSLMKKNSHGSYFPDYLENLSDSYSFSSGSFTLTEVDTVRHIVNGHFSGTAKNLKGQVVQITDGKIINGTLNWNIIRYE